MIVPRPEMGVSNPIGFFTPLTEGKSMTSPIPKRAPGRAAPAMEISPVVFHGSPLRHELYRTLYGSKLSAEEIAQRLGISGSYLRRAVLTGDSAVRFPLDLFVELMRQCDDFRALQLIARECGYVAVPVAQIRQTKKKAAESMNETAAGVHALIGDLIAFFARPEATAVAGIRQRIRRHLAAMAALDEAVRSYTQMELEELSA
jgi:hypothetical protein